MKQKYYTLKNILAKQAHYNLIIGERSNGKTYAVLKYGIEEYFKTNGESRLAIVRRWKEDLRGKRGASMFEGLVANGEVKKLSKGEWTGVYYYSGRWFFCRYDEHMKRETAEEPFAYGFALNEMEHDKSTSYPKVQTILFDEFLTRSYYLPDEFILFMNVLSTIIRDRKGIKIFMCGNTVNQYAPYFKEMGLYKIKEMKQGEIDVYKYGESELKVAVEFSDTPNKKKDSDIYFAFDNPKLNMITGKGQVWEMDIYPHCPVKYLPKEVLFNYFIQFNGDILHAEIIQHDDMIFTYIHRKTTPIKDFEHDLIYSPDASPRPNIRRKITKPTTSLENKIAYFFTTDKVFYQDNEVGEIVRNYIKWCHSA